MSLVSKLKNILFEEEEVEIPVIEKKEKKEVLVQEIKEVKKEEVKSPNNYGGFYDNLEPAINEERKMEERNSYQKDVSEREIFKSDNTFNFPAFDEEEFESVMPKRTNSVMDYERKKQEKRVEYKRIERKEETPAPKAKFKPSPIISPVYGILDKNYTPDDITSRTESVNRNLDVDSVRKKAFGSLEDSPKVKEVEEIKVNDDKILEENLEKSRTIDELLKDSSDDIIDIHEEIFEEENLNNIESLENVEPEHVDNFEEDTLESDLFDLIDSMYENREDGE